MIKVLINSYACCPNMGSEPGMGWNWIVNLARYCELFVISEGEFKMQCEQWCNVHPEVGRYIHWFWNPVSSSIRKKCWNQGDWSFYLSYQKWQKLTANIAREICLKEKIDIIHQLNMIGFREPGYLWQVSQETNIPYIWGPINANEAFPIAYLQGASLKSKCFIFLKNSITRYQLRFSTRVHNAAQKAFSLIAASGDSAESMKKFWHVTPIIINESGCEAEQVEIKSAKVSTSLELLWVGRFIFTKQLILALRALARLKNYPIRLHIVGGTPNEEIPYKKKALDLGVSHQCIWHGRISHENVQELMQQCHLLFFTSISEGTPHVILEAFNNQLPVLCFDTCGQGDCVTNKVGMKVSLSTPEQSVNEFADRILFLLSHRDILLSMSNNCKDRANELSWNVKAKQVFDLYEKALVANTILRA